MPRFRWFAAREHPLLQLSRICAFLRGQWRACGCQSKAYWTRQVWAVFVIAVHGALRAHALGAGEFARSNPLHGGWAPRVVCVGVGNLFLGIGARFSPTPPLGCMALGACRHCFVGQCPVVFSWKPPSRNYCLLRGSSVHVDGAPQKPAAPQEWQLLPKASIDYRLRRVNSRA